ncbi:MAG: RsmD family RNA methyltransferase, partial [Deltaproteobacteria bacterium]|nr:RsmD family RNA methyltransferase [Deltaproteobacteria bacterium]
VFMDPPYNKNMIGRTLCNLHLSNSLEKKAFIVVEHSLSEPIPENLPEFELVDQRKYGKTLVSFLNYI